MIFKQFCTKIFKALLNIKCRLSKHLSSKKHESYVWIGIMKCCKLFEKSIKAIICVVSSRFCELLYIFPKNIFARIIKTMVDSVLWSVWGGLIKVLWWFEKYFKEHKSEDLGGQYKVLWIFYIFGFQKRFLADSIKVLVIDWVLWSVWGGGQWVRADQKLLAAVLITQPLLPTILIKVKPAVSKRKQKERKEKATKK